MLVFQQSYLYFNLGDFSPPFCDRSVPVYPKNDLVYVIFTYLKCRLSSDTLHELLNYFLITSNIIIHLVFVVRMYKF